MITANMRSRFRHLVLPPPCDNRCRRDIWIRRVTIVVLHLFLPFLVYHIYFYVSRKYGYFSQTPDYFLLILVVIWILVSAALVNMKLQYRIILMLFIIVIVPPLLFLSAFLYVMWLGYGL